MGTEVGGDGVPLGGDHASARENDGVATDRAPGARPRQERDDVAVLARLGLRRPEPTDRGALFPATLPLRERAGGGSLLRDRAKLFRLRDQLERRAGGTADARIGQGQERQRVI